jgi:hypothetical protein
MENEMSKQYNRREKKARRQSYIKRKKAEKKIASEKHKKE